MTRNRPFDHATPVPHPDRARRRPGGGAAGLPDPGNGRNSAAGGPDLQPRHRPIERALRLPPRLLDAISLVETGRWDAERRASFAWPWTVYAEGKGRYRPTQAAAKAAAIAAVRRLQARGVRNIDVGCMQINLHYHGDASANLEQMFDPGRSVVYAARMLKQLRRVKRSWSRAVAIYHSSTRALGRPYWKKVYAMWHRERRRAWDRLRMLRRDGYRERGRRVASRWTEGR